MSRTIKIIGMSLVIALGVVFFLPPRDAAATVIGFNAGHIIDDIIFTDSTSMSPQDIQTFLNSKVPACDTWGKKMYNSTLTRAQFAASIGQSPPFTCVRDYVENGLSAAQIIYNAAQAYHISPKVLIVLLQKEQGLITDEWPYASQYRTATGYGCPDTAACDTKYYGFTNQINNASNMFHQIMIASPNWYTPYVVGNNYIQYNPTASCGGTNVFITNRATQALYNYTPYQPNQAALNADWGTAPPCGAYGNRNFYLYFTSWFGAVYSGEAGVFKGDASGAVYVRSGQYKVGIPSMALLQDYGYDPSKIAAISQARVDEIPTPPATTGFSSSIGYLLKTPSDTDIDGGAVYFVTRGQKNVIRSMDQFNAFGFKVSDIRYTSIDFIDAIPSGYPLSDFIQMPDGALMRVASGTRQAIFDMAAYNTLNPNGYYTPVSEAAMAATPGSDPLSSSSVVLKKDSADPIYVYSGGKYYFVPSQEVYDCLGINREQRRSLVTVPTSRISATITAVSNLTCSATINNTNYIFNVNDRYTSDVTTGVSATSTLPTTMSDFVQTYNDRGILKQYVKANGDSTIWTVAANKRKAIPSFNNYSLFGAPAYDTLPASVVNTLAFNGIAFADGALVKVDGQPAVYAISGGSRYIVPSAETFTSNGFSWGKIETYSEAELGAYPRASTRVTPYYVDNSQNLFLLAQGSCYAVPKDFLPAYSLPLTPTAYNKATLRSMDLTSCKPAVKIVKAAYTTSPVYILENGRKLPFASWATLVNYTNSYNPTITPVSDDLLAQYPIGPTLR